MTEYVLPQHTNPLQTIFGGVILSWIDIAASICAQRHCHAIVVTASLDTMYFLAPMRIGWIANIKASVNYVHNTSCEIGVRIIAENPRTQELFHTASAYLTMVALNSNGKPTPMPPLRPESEEEKRRCREGEERRENRLLLKKKLVKD
jgi:acyl-CoA hydrolase